MPVQCNVDDPGIQSDKEMDLDIEEEPQLSKMSSPEHHQFSGTDTETETETEISQLSEFLYRARKCSTDCVGSNQLFFCTQMF